MDYRKIIKEIGRGNNHAVTWTRRPRAACIATCWMVTCRSWKWVRFSFSPYKGEGEAEMLGFYDAMQKRRALNAATTQTHAYRHSEL
ncbi:glycosyl transferase [Escherichia coli]